MVVEWLLVAAGAFAAPGAYDTDDRPPERFAIVIGYNRSFRTDQQPLSYADDDALRTYELLQTVVDVDNIWLLAEVDTQTLVTFPEISNKARSPTRPRLREAVLSLARAIDAARRRGRRPEVFFFYSGHGGTQDGRGFIELADGPFTAEDLEQRVIGPLASARLHLIIDSCDSYYLIRARGPGGRRYRVEPGIVEPFFSRHRHVGVFLSTSTSDRVFEWSEIQAGIFSHELRSGLLGPADADEDGSISYRELELFVRNANRGIRNEKYRPRIFVRPPADDGLTPLLPTPRVRRLRVAKAGRYTLYDDRGFRVADLNSAKGSVILGLPGVSKRTFVLQRHSANGPRTITVPTSTGTIDVSTFDGGRPAASRGSEALVFSNLFTYPFPPSEDPAAWMSEQARSPLPSYDFVHGPLAAFGFQSGHLDSLSVVPTLWLGYRFAWDRFALDAMADLGLTPQVGTVGRRFQFRRVGFLLGPRYEWPFGQWSLASGPVVGGAWEQQVPSAGGQSEQAASGFWSWRLGIGWQPSSAVQFGLDGYVGGRVLQVDDNLEHRWVGGLSFSIFLIP